MFRTFAQIEKKLYRLRQMGFSIKDKIYLRAIKQRALKEKIKNKRCKN